jgi:hypothetical protein
MGTDRLPLPPQESNPPRIREIRADLVKIS